ncbi:unnamed protein product [Pneumocystis jirovecii]|uniref:Uncharacterized protein n=1 Tax=Pneumocystis jirovecii TaxID=42068 RepID=L0PEK3_PNEJI|nr:unnamed protein product [Pneumocystis jirovecii]
MVCTEKNTFFNEIPQQNMETEQYIYENEVNYIMKEGKNTDILITYEWPKDIYKFSSKKSSKFVPGIQPIAKITSYIQPKYHFSSKGSIFYEREPYENIFTEDKQEASITRFISLASFNNPNKERSSYAFNITKSNPYNMLNTSNISNVTENPFMQEISINSKETKHNFEESKHNFFRDKNVSSNNKKQEHNIKISVESYKYINEEKNKETNSQISKNHVYSMYKLSSQYVLTSKAFAIR